MKTLLILITLLLSLHAQNVAESLYENVLLKNIVEANQNLDKLQKSLSKNSSEKELKDGFKDMMQSWKKVQTLYLAADLDEDYIDTPRYIDTFHEGKENLYRQLERILLSQDAVEIELFKNSTKSINALEYLMFKAGEKTTRQKEMVVYILKHIAQHLKSIENFYRTNKKLFREDTQKMNAFVMNALIESSFKLKEWRVGDPAGLSRKYRNNPESRRSEYPISKLSYSAIEAILLTHQAVIGKEEFANFSNVVRSAGADRELENVRKHIKNALQSLHKAPAYDFESQEIKEVYKELTALHNAYYISLIGVLKITSKILDADGD